MPQDSGNHQEDSRADREFKRQADDFLSLRVASLRHSVCRPKCGRLRPGSWQGFPGIARLSWAVLGFRSLCCAAFPLSLRHKAASFLNRPNWCYALVRSNLNSTYVPKLANGPGVHLSTIWLRPPRPKIAEDPVEAPTGLTQLRHRARGNALARVSALQALRQSDLGIGLADFAERRVGGLGAAPCRRRGTLKTRIEFLVGLQTRARAGHARPLRPKTISRCVARYGVVSN
jgi:hypothetical protein